MDDASHIEIDIAALTHNVRAIQQEIGPACRICAVVKADGYGLGARRVAVALDRAGAHMLAVYAPSEAAALLEVCDVPLLVLMPVRSVPPLGQLAAGLRAGRLHLTVHDAAHAASVSSLAEVVGCVVPVHVEVDTGMRRGGCSAADAADVLRRVIDDPSLRLSGVMTHFACAESCADTTDRQLEELDDVLDQVGAPLGVDCIVHAANTAATVGASRYHRSMVRVGFAWAGFTPVPGAAVRGMGMSGQPTVDLRPVVRWMSRIVQVKNVKAGDRVGYGSQWTASRDSRLAIVPAGYADGFPCGVGWTDAEPGGAFVRVRRGPVGGDGWDAAPVIGAVNMDQISIDVTDLPGAGDIAPGREIEVLGAEPDAPNGLATLARLAGTIPHDMLCRLSPRLPRVLLNETGNVEIAAASSVTAAG